MSIESELKNEGIVVIKNLNALQVHTIAKFVAEKLVSNFPEQNLNLDNLIFELSKLNMCIAKMPPDGAAAKFYYKNSTLYFHENLSFDDIENLAIHECIHFIQQSTDSNNKLVRLGLCDFSNSYLNGMGVNEAAVQFMASKCLDSKNEDVKYYDIEFSTISPSYYPLQCNLIGQISYIIGEDILFNSTLYGNDNFKEKFISVTNQDIFYTIQKNIDSIVYLEDELNNLSNTLANMDGNIRKIERISKKIIKQKQKISKVYFDTQNLIFTGYFNHRLNELVTLKDIDNFRNKLFGYKDLIGKNDKYSYFSDYYLQMMQKLEQKYEALEDGNVTTLVVQKNNLFVTLFKKLRLLFKKEYQSSDVTLIQK